MNRRLPVVWWQRPQYWTPEPGDDGEVRMLSSLFWGLRELVPWGIDTALREIQPNGGDRAD